MLSDILFSCIVLKTVFTHTWKNMKSHFVIWPYVWLRGHFKILALSQMCRLHIILFPTSTSGCGALILGFCESGAECRLEPGVEEVPLPLQQLPWGHTRVPGNWVRAELLIHRSGSLAGSLKPDKVAWVSNVRSLGPLWKQCGLRYVYVPSHLMDKTTKGAGLGFPWQTGEGVGTQFLK